LSHKSETRISAIADFAAKGKRKKKALLLSLLAGRRDHNPGALEEVLTTSAAPLSANRPVPATFFACGGEE